VKDRNSKTRNFFTLTAKHSEFVLVCGYHYNAQKYQDIFKENMNCYGKKVKQVRDFVVVKE
jgi:hypothetical protein